MDSKDHHVKRSVLRSAAIAIAVLTIGFLGAPLAFADEQPKVPQQVSAYFANDLIPRLIDLYGSGDGVATGTDFDATTTVGGISRVFEWTPDYLAGKHSDEPTRFTNNWVASVSVRGEFLGLATVWINPATDLPELASFDSPELARQLSAIPAKSSLVHDAARQAWFALNGDVLVPLVAGTSGVTDTTTPDVYQRSFLRIPPVAESGLSGVAISALVLGVVILGLAILVLLPVRKRAAKGTQENDEEREIEEGEIEEGEIEEDPDDGEIEKTPKAKTTKTKTTKTKTKTTTKKTT